MAFITQEFCHRRIETRQFNRKEQADLLNYLEQDKGKLNQDVLQTDEGEPLRKRGEIK